MNKLFSLVNNTVNGEAIQTVSARELHEFLESKRQFANWIQEQIDSYGFIEGEDFLTNLLKTPNGGRPRIEYHISLDMAKELSMVERNEKGKQARLYFIECERKAKSVPMLPQSFSEALRLAADLQDQLALAARNAAALDRISQADGDLCITDAAKTLGMKRTELFDWLSSHEWIYKRPNGSAWIAHQPKLNSGYLRHIERRYNNGEGGFNVTTQVVVTPKGLARLAQLHLKEVA